MRCTECSKEVKPVVAVDIDGTLGDYHGHFINFAETYLGIFGATDEFATYDGRDRFKHWCQGMWDIDDRTWHDIKLAYRQGAMKRSMPVYPGARDLCDRIRDAGAELWLTTTRPYVRLDNVDPDTRFWLDHHGIQYDGLLYDDGKYALLAEYVDPERVVAVLDDEPEQFNAAAAAFSWRTPLLRRIRFNRGISCGQDVEDLHVAANIITDRITEWKEAYGGSRERLRVEH